MSLRTLLHLALPATFAAVALTAAAAFAQSPTSTSTPAATATPPTTPPTPPALATCPAGMTVTVAPPSAAAPTTLTVTLNPTVTLKPGTAGDPQSMHLHYFIDTNPVEVLKAGQPIPIGDPKIIHTANTTQDLAGTQSRALTPGDHRVWVVVGRLDHVPCDPMVVGSTTYTVVPPPTPIAPRTGSGTASGAEGISLLALAGALGAAVVALGLGGLRLTRRD